MSRTGTPDVTPMYWDDACKHLSRRDRVMRRLDRFGPSDEIGNKTFPDMKTLPRQGPNENTLIGARSFDLANEVTIVSAHFFDRLFEQIQNVIGLLTGDGPPFQS